MLNPPTESLNLARRRFLMNSSCSVASYALAAMMQKEGLLAGEDSGSLANPLAPKDAHFPGTAKFPWPASPC